MGHSIKRYHDICAGHRVAGHESKCSHLHGHNYRIHFTCEPVLGLDKLGRVVDFSVVKSQLCEWVEEHWDHKFLMWEKDPVVDKLEDLLELVSETTRDPLIGQSIVRTPFNPTAENMAKHLVDVVGPIQLLGTGVVLTEVMIDETAKCSASYKLKTGSTT